MSQEKGRVPRDYAHQPKLPPGWLKEGLPFWFAMWHREGGSKGGTSRWFRQVHSASTIQPLADRDSDGRLHMTVDQESGCVSGEGDDASAANGWYYGPVADLSG